MWLPETIRGAGSTWEVAKLHTTPKEVYAKKREMGKGKGPEI